ncbi:hypothetical protein [Streptomyces sp. HUAS ZL42]|uniref:hypothetical protein n=1 Tax=Streptomyces sp. HUAS ZL42 TaxID=3231715 RepID=UPI00345E3631
MGVDVVLMRVHQPGTSRRRRRSTPVEVLVDHGDAFARLCAGSVLPLLSRIDPYGSLHLTSAQMPQLADELAALRTRTGLEADRGTLDQVMDLARRCAGDAATELHFEGD